MSFEMGEVKTSSIKMGDMKRVLKYEIKNWALKLRIKKNRI